MHRLTWTENVTNRDMNSYMDIAIVLSGSHRDPYLDDEEDSMDDDDDEDNQEYGDSIFHFGRNGFSYGSRNHGGECAVSIKPQGEISFKFPK